MARRPSTVIDRHLVGLPADTPLPWLSNPRGECNQRALACQGNPLSRVLLPAMRSDSDRFAGRLQGALALVGGATLLLYALWPWLPRPGREVPPRTVVFYGFRILGEAMTGAGPPDFARRWQAQTGEHV